METTNGTENTAPKETHEANGTGLNLNMEIDENTETSKAPQTKKPLEVDDLNDESDSDSDQNNDIDIDIGEEGPAVDHPLLDIDKVFLFHSHSDFQGLR